MRGSIRVGSVVAEPGTKLHGHVRVGERPLGSEIALPIMILNGAQEGPVLWINGALHGNELNGSVAARNVFLQLDPAEVRGALAISPICNPVAFEARQKLSNLDFLDLESVFPGDPKGLLSQQIAHILFQEIVRTATCLVDLHTTGSLYDAIPYTVLKIVPGASPDVLRRAEEMALAFGMEVNCRLDLEAAAGSELPGTAAGALDIACMKKGIPAFMGEHGRGGCLQEENIALAERCIQNLMKFLEMIPGDPELPEERTAITRRYFVRSDIGGLVRMLVHPGQIVSRGQPLAEVFDFMGSSQLVVADEDNYVLIARVDPVVETGARLLFVASEWASISDSQSSTG